MFFFAQSADYSLISCTTLFLVRPDSIPARVLSVLFWQSPCCSMLSVQSWDDSELTFESKLVKRS